jgi:hypothetical protein
VPQCSRNRLEVAAFQVEILEGLLETVERTLRQRQIVVRQLQRLQPQRHEGVVRHEPDPVVRHVQAVQDSDQQTKIKSNQNLYFPFHLVVTEDADMMHVT